MPQLQIKVPFLSGQLSEDVKLAGSSLTLTTVSVLENMVAEIASQKLSLELDPYHPLEFTQREAYLRGQMDILSHLLYNHELTTHQISA